MAQDVPISVDAIRAEMERVDAIREATTRLRSVIEKVPDEDLRAELESATSALEGVWSGLISGGQVDLWSGACAVSDRRLS